MPQDIPAVASSVDAAVRNVLTRAREELQILLGFRGDLLDKALTLRDFGYTDISTLKDGFGGVGPQGPVGPVGPAGPSGSETPPDLTPPPTVTGLTITAGLGNVFIEWDAAVYTQGHGHGQTNLYAAKKAAADTTLPTFGDAVRVYDATGALTLAALPSDLSIRWHVWAKWQTVDGVESSSPAGGTNGVSAQTGKIGNADLTDLLITADKLSQGTYPNVNLVPNPGAEDSVSGVPVAWALVEGVAGTFTADTSDKTGGTNSFRITKALATDNVAYGCRAFPVIPGETYSVKLRARGNVASAAGHYFRMQEKTTAPTSGYIDSANRTSFTDLAAASNGPINATWTAYEYTYTAPAGIYWATLAMYCWGASTNTSLWWDDCSVGRQITASSIAAGSIAVGTAAIQNGAIVNAMIGAAAIDDAKIASLSAAKVTFGAMHGDRIDVNTLNGNRILANTVTATMIDSRGLSIKDAGGNVIFSSGTPLAVANASAGLINSNLSFGTNLVYNSAFDLGMDGWTYSSGNLISPSSSGLNYSPDWRLAPAGAPGTSVFYTYQGGVYGNPDAYYEYESKAIPVVAGGRYILSAYTGAHRCNVGLFLRVYDAAGSLIQDGAAYSMNYAAAAGGQSLAGYMRLSGAVDIVAGGAYCKVFLSKFDTYSGQADSYSFFTRIMLEQNIAPASNPGAWADSGYSDPTQVRATNQITSGNASTYIANAAIGTAQINTLDASVITAGTITTDRIQVGAASAASNGGATGGIVPIASGNTSMEPAQLNVVSLTTTGAPVMVTGQLHVSLSLGNTNAAVLSLRWRLWVDGSTLLDEDTVVLPTVQNYFNARDCWTQIPVVARHTPAAGSHTYSVQVLAIWWDTAGTGVTAGASSDMEVSGDLVVQENKV